MVRRRGKTLALVGLSSAALAVGLPACSFLFGLDHLTEASASGDASADDVASGNDGGDAPFADAPAPSADSSLDARADRGPVGPPFCSTVDATFCADFDESTLYQAWPGQTSWDVPSSEFVGTVLQDPSRFVSAPNSLQAVNVLYDAGPYNNTYAYLEKDFTDGGVPASVHVEFQAFFGAPPAYDVDLIAFSLGSPSASCANGYFLRLRGVQSGTNVELHLTEVCEPDNAPNVAAMGAIAPVGSWSHITLDLVLDPPDGGDPDADVGTGSLQIQVDQNGPVSTSITPPPSSGPFSVYLGVNGAIFGQSNAPWTVNYDNFVLDLP